MDPEQDKALQQIWALVNLLFSSVTLVILSDRPKGAEANGHIVRKGSWKQYRDNSETVSREAALSFV